MWEEASAASVLTCKLLRYDAHALFPKPLAGLLLEKLPLGHSSVLSGNTSIQSWRNFMVRENDLPWELGFKVWWEDYTLSILRQKTARSQYLLRMSVKGMDLVARSGALHRYYKLYSIIVVCARVTQGRIFCNYVCSICTWHQIFLIKICWCNHI